VLVAPTSASARPASFRPVIDLNGTKTRVLPEQTRAIDAQHLGDFAGRLTASELAELDHAYRVILDLAQ